MNKVRMLKLGGRGGGYLLTGEAVMNRWTVPLEWNGGMEYWNDPYKCKSMMAVRVCDSLYQPCLVITTYDVQNKQNEVKTLKLGGAVSVSISLVVPED